MVMNHKIIVDTREKTPWEFENSVSRKLDVGDYSIEGYESILAVERKATTSEFARNINESRFLDVLDRLDSIRYGFIICEFTMDDVLSFPRNSGIPQKLWNTVRVHPNYILKCILEYQMRYNVNILMCGSQGREVAKSIFKRVLNGNK